MKHRIQKPLVNIAFFGIALGLILYLQRHQSNKRTFAWTTIRYKTTSATLPTARGICPGLAGSSKPALVVSRVAADGEPNWLNSLANLYHICVYTADGPADSTSTYLQVPANRGHEAMAYLTFVIDNYAHIPAAGAVFVHGSRWAWHNDEPEFDNAALLAALNVSRALALTGYHNLRCDWSAGTCSPSSGPAQGSLETSARAVLEPWNTRAASDALLPRALATLFGGDKSAVHLKSVTDEFGSAGGESRLLLGRNNVLRANCCAQFAVSLDRIWQHSRDEYVALRQWLLDGSSDSEPKSKNVAPKDDRVAGRILSYVWHILYLPPSADGSVDLEQLNTLACPSAKECYCRLYGRCDLDGCTADSCYGQYRLPPGFKLPDDWAATHS